MCERTKYAGRQRISIHQIFTYRVRRRALDRRRRRFRAYNGTRLLVSGHDGVVGGGCCSSARRGDGPWCAPLSQRLLLLLLLLPYCHCCRRRKGTVPETVKTRTNGGARQRHSLTCRLWPSFADTAWFLPVATTRRGFWPSSAWCPGPLSRGANVWRHRCKQNEKNYAFIFFSFFLLLFILYVFFFFFSRRLFYFVYRLQAHRGSNAWWNFNARFGGPLDVVCVPTRKTKKNNSC